ncbi:MAG TPA: hypothetical protein DCM08_02530 [Microscillaceae bacterium]|jgi:hypothetical protein|nr:hypothetical protein [Microscillaceae bacterium]
MKKSFFIISLVCLVLCSLQTFAQKDVESDSDADRKETIAWIEGKVKEYGNFVYYFRGKNEFFDASINAEGGSVCRWEYRFSESFYDDPERGKGSKPRNYVVKFDLKDITEITLSPVEGKYQTKTDELYYTLEFRTFNDANKAKVIQKRTFSNTRKRDNEIALHISDKDIAERMLKAFQHALELCNKGNVKEEKF